MTDLTLTPIPPTGSGRSGGCGCGGGSTDVPDRVAATGAVAYPVAGMTCGGCVSRVARAVRRLDGVDSVEVDLVPGGLSTVTVTGAASPGDVRRALADAGYPANE